MVEKNYDEAQGGWHTQCADAARRIAAEAFDVSDDALNAPNRSLSDIATAFARDRTTVSYACRRVEDKRDELIFDMQLERLEASMRREMERIRMAELLEVKGLQTSDMMMQRGRGGLFLERTTPIIPFRRWRR